MENKGKEGQNKKLKPLKVLKTIWKVFEKILLVIIIFISLIIITQRVSNNEKSFLGYRIFRVQTGSMIPVYQIGDVIIVKEKAIDKISEGDDVTYWGTSGAMKGKLVTHRVIKIEVVDGKKHFHTQGVANTLEDPVVYGEQINGVVQGKSYLMTGICTLLTNQYIFYFAGILPLTIFIFFAFMKDKVKRYEE